ncbi:MAG: AmmeMemoRadiSam system protein A, partial [Pseudomonadota bacterium]
IVLGPAHRGAFRGLSITGATHYRTPLGDVPIDVDAVAALRKSPLVGEHPDAEAPEHSIEAQLPFLVRALRPGWKLVPILVGSVRPAEAAAVADALRSLADENTLIVASGDFTHYGPNYGYIPFAPGPDAAARIKGMDYEVIRLMSAGDPAAFVSYHERTGITVCGFLPFLVLMHLLPPDARGQDVAYDTSGAKAGSFVNSVSYLAAVFSGPTPFAAGLEVLPQTELEALLSLARRAVEEAVLRGEEAGDKTGPPSSLGPRLARNAGVFVTLKKNGDLRGCIGSIQPREPMWLAVVHAAVSAALRDWRFERVRPDELAQLTVQVSVLSPLRPIPGWEAFQPGEHGIVMYKDGKSAVFLPEVAREQGWGREETLSHLSTKAGLSPQAWREGARFEVFTSQIVEKSFFQK